jgi:DNA (cytosine-5)-methyltransferase 1
MREFVHPTQDRFLTLRECARIQSFPDAFRFCGATTSKLQQIGNAIPPAIGEVIGYHLREYMASEGAVGEGNPQPKLLGYFLTKANAMSPALQRTASLLEGLAASLDEHVPELEVQVSVVGQQGLDRTIPSGV